MFVANASRATRATKLNTAIAEASAELGIVPPIRAIDHEGGIVQRIKDIPNLGSNGDFGRTRPTDQAACERGAAHAEQLRAMGFDMSLGRVDVATNPRNPVIGDRSYGRRPELVARLGAAYIRGLQGGGIIGSGKHFPGHGDTSVDLRHLGLPVIKAGRKRLDAVGAGAVVAAMAPGPDVASIMVGHLALPRLDRAGTRRPSRGRS